ncbi:DUF6515 family protein [Algoriphagus sp. AGSA1]|uniref:DUF6515 family protein n=1 Tax=Algoriphagus sp. AGSA1 TaxID=2907213 RepID=UPI0034CD7EB0
MSSSPSPAKATPTDREADTQWHLIFLPYIRIISWILVLSFFYTILLGSLWYPSGFFIASLATTANVVSVEDQQCHYDQGTMRSRRRATAP